MRFVQTQPIIPGTASNASINSAPIDTRQQYSFSLQCSATTGTCAGTFQVQVSNDPVVGSFTNYSPKNWTNLGIALTFAQSSTASNQIVQFTQLSYVAMRVVYTDSSSGTNTATITASIGALGV